MKGKIINKIKWLIRLKRWNSDWLNIWTIRVIQISYKEIRTYIKAIFKSMDI